MQVNPLPIQIIFEKDVLHRVPLFQRPYVWNREDQWEPLWNDIRRLSEKVLNKKKARAHFLGASVHSKPKVLPGQIETRNIIDGQQRFTTLQLFLKAFENVASSVASSDYVEAIVKLTRNNHPLSKSDDEKFKVWPTNADREHFTRTMGAGSPEALCNEYGYSEVVDSLGPAIPDAYLYYFSVISEWINADSETVKKRIAALYSTVRERIQMVIIDLDEQDDAQMIFETLNARGTPLLAADLVKNALLQEALDKKKNVEKLYNENWRDFDFDQTFWRELIGPGHARRQRIENYLQNFLTLTLRSVVRADRLYPTYQEYAESSAGGSVEDRFSALAKYGRIYRRIVERDVSSPRAKLSLERFDVLDVGTAYPFLLELLSRLEGSEKFLVPCLVDVESFLVRRMVCGLSTRGYNTLFLNLVGKTKGSPDKIHQRVRQELLSGSAEANRWPDDAEFHDDWMSTEVYRTVRRGRLRLLLEALERASRGKKTETDYVQPWLPVEHLMPQAWHEHWPLPKSKPELESTIERNSLIHTIGNLTLLTSSLNSSVSNGPWSAKRGGGKRAALSDHSVLFLNKRIVKAKTWSHASIRRRSETLFQVAKGIWKRPKAKHV